MSTFAEIYKDLTDESLERYARIKAVQRMLSLIKRETSRAIALEDEWVRELAREQALFNKGNTEAAALAGDRARRIHQERCLAILSVASGGRAITRAATGDLTIDTSTADTGLCDDERAVISQVTGRGMGA